LLTHARLLALMKLAQSGDPRLDIRVPGDLIVDASY
jgi:hypothetical protein